ncbi:MAG: YphA family membrane protein [Bacillota bacterium]
MEMIGGGSVEGFFFYMGAWCCWIAAAFFMKRQQNGRMALSACLLIAIIVSPYTISLGSLHISAAGAFILICCYAEAARITRLKAIYFFVSVFMIMLAYTSFQLFALFDPVWVVFKKEWMLAAIMFAMSAVLFTDCRKRIAAMLTGAIQGDFLFSMVLEKLSLAYEAWSFSFLDMAAISSCALLLWDGFVKLAAYLERQAANLEKEKQKIL